MKQNEREFAGNIKSRNASGNNHEAHVVEGRIDLSISLLRANFVMVYFAVPTVVLLGAPYLYIWGGSGLKHMITDNTSLLWLAGIIIIGIFVHEAIHGITWVLGARKPLSSITFGFSWKTITPYAHCREAMKARPYRLGAVMPLLLLGILPSLAGIAGGWPLVMFTGLFFTFAAGGDMLILWLIRRVNADTLVEDHPSRAGCYVVTEPPIKR